MFKLGLDRHGVISAAPKFFSELSKLVQKDGGEVHILTGSSVDDRVIGELRGYGIVWDKLFSTADYHKSLGTPLRFSDPNNPWIEDVLWDRTKGDYCFLHNIDFHIDDTGRYGEYFKTPFCAFDVHNRRFDWHYIVEKTGAFIIASPEEVYRNMVTIAKSVTKGAS